MTHSVDTLQVYEELTSSGFSEQQAKANIKAMGYFISDLATKTDIRLLEKDLKIFFGYLVGGTIIVAVLIPVILKFADIL
jgi:hypothetical protein